MYFPLIDASGDAQAQASIGLHPETLERLDRVIARHLEDGRYPGCQVAIACRGTLLLDRSYGLARTGEGLSASEDPWGTGDVQGLDDRVLPASSRTLWVLYSNTKMLIAACLWRLAEAGEIRFADPVARYLPGFAQNGKEGVTLCHLITHQAGFPQAEVPAAMWSDMRKVLAFYNAVVPAREAASQVHYHPLSAHWVLALVIEAVTGDCYRAAVREQVIRPLKLEDELVMGLEEPHLQRMAFLYEPDPLRDGTLRLRAESLSALWQRSAVPGGGAYGTARGMAALYQALLLGGRLGGARWLSPRTLDYAIRNYTGDRPDAFMGMPMHRGLGPHLRGESVAIRGLGDIAPAQTFGHGGVGSSYCWGDPTSGVSFAYLSNARSPEPWHSQRMNQLSNLVHAAIDPIRARA